jgi:hypothetical protein
VSASTSSTSRNWPAQQPHRAVPEPPFVHRRPKMDPIIRGENRVYPREIDEVLDERPAVGVMCPLYDALGEEFGTAADMYALI